MCSDASETPVRRSGGPSIRNSRLRHERPAVLPEDGGEEGLATEVMMTAAGRTNAEQHRPRRAVVEIDEVGVTSGLDRMARSVAMREQRAVG